MPQKVKSPQDHRPKAARLIAAENGDGPGFTFTWEGRTYRLPPVSAGDVPAGALMDALEGGGDLAEVRLGLAVLKAADVPEDALRALRAMPLRDFSPLLSDWMSGSGVDAGESSRSSPS